MAESPTKDPKKKGHPYFFWMFVTVVSSSLISFALGGMLIGSTYEYALIEPIQGQNEETMDLMYPACIAIGSIFIIVATLLAWIGNIEFSELIWFLLIIKRFCQIVLQLSISVSYSGEIQKTKKVDISPGTTKLLSKTGKLP